MTKGTIKKATSKPVAAARKISETQVTPTRVNMPSFKKENFQEISIDAPCKIFVDKKTSAIYITTEQVAVVSKKKQIR